MLKKATVGDLFGWAIEAERTAEKLYRGLEAKFAFHQELARFWRGSAAEEAGHARWLERLRNGLEAKQLSAVADPDIVQQVRAVLQFSIEDALGELENLEEAYQLVNELENSETNAIFEFLISNFAEDVEIQSFLRAQLRKHIVRLTTEFPIQSIAIRLSTKALDL